MKTNATAGSFMTENTKQKKLTSNKSHKHTDYIYRANITDRLQHNKKQKQENI